MNELLRLDKVTCAYARDPVLVNVSVSIRPGDFLGVVGPSGSGKTTLLKAIAGVIRPIAGAIHSSGPVRIGYVPQVESVNWHFPVTAREVVLMARTTDRRVPWPSKADIQEAEQTLDRLGLRDLGGRHIRELSGGQQQRVFIARALLRRANILLLDEPTSGIDMRTRHEVMHLLHDLHHTGMAIVLSTHDLNGIAAHLPRLMLLNREVIAVGPPVDVLTSRVLEQTYGAPLEILSHAGMPLVLERYPELQEVSPANVVALREGHHEHRA